MDIKNKLVFPLSCVYLPGHMTDHVTLDSDL